ncbi:MAG: hypothetical protein LBT15_02945, partial [Synergistaceae bacterium]|nr:hypothetical protein [Synergistaceae bacterium]
SCIEEALSSAGTYSVGAEQLKTLQDEKLLIPSGMDNPQGAFAKELPFEDYMARARVVCMGHTPMVMARLRAVTDALADLPLPAEKTPNVMPPNGGSLGGATILQTLTRLRTLRNAKIGTRDTLFLTKLADLFKRRAQLQQGRKVLYPASGVLCGLIAWFAYSVLGLRGSLFLQTIFTIIVVGAMISVLFSIGTTSPTPGPGSAPPHLEIPYGERGGRRDMNALLLFPLLTIAGSFALFNTVLASYPAAFPFGVGAMAGVNAYALYFRRAMKKLFTDITEACFTWNNTPPEI